MKKIFLIFICSWVFSERSLGQVGKIDSLREVLKSSKDDTVKVNILNELSYAYFVIDPIEGINIGNKALLLASKLSWQKGIAQAYENIGWNYWTKSDYLHQLYYEERALTIYEKLDDKNGKAKAFAAIGIVYYSQQNFKQALKSLSQALKLFEELNDRIGIAQTYGNFGIVYSSMGDFSKAFEVSNKALKEFENIGNKEGIAINIAHIGDYYGNTNNPIQALEFYFKSLKLYEEMQNKKFIAILFGNIGIQYLNLLKLPDNDKKVLISKVKDYSKRAIKLNKEMGSVKRLQENYETLAEVNKLAGNYKEAMENQEQSAIYKDSLYSTEIQKKLAEYETKAEFESKEKLILNLNKDNLLKKREIENQKLQKYSFIICSILVMALAIVIYNRYRLKQKSNKLLEEKNEMNIKAYNDLKKAEEQLIQSEKMASLGQLTSGVAHEINNPINFVSANVKPLKRNYEELVDFLLKKRNLKEEDLNYNIVESKQLFIGIEEGAKRTAEIVKGLRNFSRLDEGEKKKVNIIEGIESTLLLVNNLLAKKNIEVIKLYGELPKIECYPGQLNQVFMNILTNAIDAIGEKGRVAISTSQESNKIKVSIHDTGKGMSEEIKQKIFDPFFTTKDVGKGTGLGLSISHGIIEKHNGKIEVKSEVGKGIEFIIILPLNA